MGQGAVRHLCWGGGRLAGTRNCLCAHAKHNERVRGESSGPSDACDASDARGGDGRGEGKRLSEAHHDPAVQRKVVICFSRTGLDARGVSPLARPSPALGCAWFVRTMSPVALAKNTGRVGAMAPPSTGAVGASWGNSAARKVCPGNAQVVAASVTHTHTHTNTHTHTHTHTWRCSPAQFTLSHHPPGCGGSSSPRRTEWSRA
jgi:hypothetical protein